jgi:hypothetical protein
VDPASSVPPWPQVAARLAGGWTRLPLDIDLGDNVSVERSPTGTLTLR